MNKRKEVSRLSAGRTLTRTPECPPEHVEYEENFRTGILSPAPARSDGDDDTDSYNDEYSPRERRQRQLFPSIKVEECKNGRGNGKSSGMFRSLSANYNEQVLEGSRPSSTNSLGVNSPVHAGRHGGKQVNVYGNANSKQMSLSESSLCEAVRRSENKEKLSATLKPDKVVRPKLKDSGILPTEGPRVVDISPTSNRRQGSYAKYDRQPSPDISYSSDEGTSRRVPVRLVPIHNNRSRSVSPGRNRPRD